MPRFTGWITPVGLIVLGSLRALRQFEVFILNMLADLPLSLPGQTFSSMKMVPIRGTESIGGFPFLHFSCRELRCKR
jgi:hypothetical protein